MIYTVNEVARELEDPYGSPACCFGNALRLDYLNDLFLARLLVSFCGNSAPHQVDAPNAVERHYGDVSSAHENVLVEVTHYSGSQIAADYPVCSLPECIPFTARPLPLQGYLDSARAGREGQYRRTLIDACVQASASSVSTLSKHVLA